MEPDPLRGRRTAAFGPAAPNVLDTVPFPRPGFVRYHTADPRQNGTTAGIDAGVVDARSPCNVGGSLITDAFSGAVVGVGPGPDTFPNELVPFSRPREPASRAGRPRDADLRNVRPHERRTKSNLPEQSRETVIKTFSDVSHVFGGDFVGPPCVQPGSRDITPARRKSSAGWESSASTRMPAPRHCSIRRHRSPVRGSTQSSPMSSRPAWPGTMRVRSSWSSSQPTSVQFRSSLFQSLPSTAMRTMESSELCSAAC